MLQSLECLNPTNHTGESFKIDTRERANNDDHSPYSVS